MAVKLTYKELEKKISDLEKEITRLNRSEADYKTIFKYSPAGILLILLLQIIENSDLRVLSPSHM